MKWDLNPYTLLQGQLHFHCAIHVISTRDVLFHEGPIPFGSQNASRLYMLSVSLYLQSLSIPDTAAPFQDFMEPALS